MKLVIFLCALTLLSGCTIWPGTSPDKVISAGRDATMRYENVEIQGDLIVRPQAHLNVIHSRLVINGSITVQGVLEATDSQFWIQRDGKARLLDIEGGTFHGARIKIVDADALRVNSGHLEIEDGALIFGRLLVNDSNLTWTRVETESNGPSIGSYEGSGRHELAGESVAMITDSTAAGTYHSTEGSHLRFLNTSVDLMSLSGPGLKEVAYRLHLEIIHANGVPVPNATVEVRSAPTMQTEDAGKSDSVGKVDLEQILADVTDTIRLHDPHLVLVNGMVFSASQAVEGDSSQRVIVP